MVLAALLPSAAQASFVGVGLKLGEINYSGVFINILDSATLMNTVPLFCTLPPHASTSELLLPVHPSLVYAPASRAIYTAAVSCIGKVAMVSSVGFARKVEL